MGLHDPYVNSNEGRVVTIVHGATGATLYAVLWSTAGCVWTTSSGGKWSYPYQTANLSLYGIPLVELGTASRMYQLTMPDDTDLLVRVDEMLSSPAVLVRAEIYAQAGASPAEGDAHVASVRVTMHGRYEGGVSISMEILRPQGDSYIDRVFLYDESIREDMYDKETAYPSQRPDVGMTKPQRVRGRLVWEKRAGK
jgi:hypothetical protein